MGEVDVPVHTENGHGVYRKNSIIINPSCVSSKLQRYTLNGV